MNTWLWREEGTVLLVGYQPTGTLGGLLEDGASSVRSSETTSACAFVRTLDIYSGHADGMELANWARAREPIRGVVLRRLRRPLMEEA